IAIIQFHLGLYLRQLSNYHVTLISMPYRRPDSPTHRALAALAIPHPKTGEEVETSFASDGRPVGSTYYLPHGDGRAKLANIHRGQRLQTDRDFRRQSDAIADAWQENLDSEVVRQ